jgi:fructose-1,6-bisphosphatase I
MIGTTITQFLIEEQKRFPSATGDLTSVINDIVTGCKTIAAAMRYGAIADDEILGIAGTENVQGEEQKNLDIIANRLFLKCTESGGHIAAMASEEMEEIYLNSEEDPKGRYLLLYDPVDGSSNLDENATFGTIFSILKRPDGATGQPDVSEFLQPGTKQVCAGYAIYGPSCMLVITMGNGVNGFTLDPLVGEFVLTHPGISIEPTSARLYANIGWAHDWSDGLRGYIWDRMNSTGKFAGIYADLRWSRCMVADVHRVLMTGGIYVSTANKALREQNHIGVTRVLYEINPLALIVEQAGGIAVSWGRRSLEEEVGELHQRGPVIMGSSDDVKVFIEKYH